MKRSDCFTAWRRSEVLRYTPHVYNEQALIAAFVKRSKRDRYREILSDPRLRRKFTAQLAHFSDFDPKYRLAIPSNKLFVDNIARELQNTNQPQPPHSCYPTTVSMAVKRLVSRLSARFAAHRTRP